MVLSHLDSEGHARMVDVSGKEITRRTGIAGGYIYMHRDALEAIKAGTTHKGNVLAVARIAGIQAAKITGNLIPLAHPLSPDEISVDFEVKENGISITGKVVCNGRTGVEMEALTAVAISALTIYDMCKSIDKEMMIGEIRLLEKYGGVSGHYKRGVHK
jgi:cyclic pyranopterin monophosphate synthase